MKAKQVSESRHAALTPDEKRAEQEAPLLAAGLRKCPHCGMIANVRANLLETEFLFHPIIYDFHEPPAVPPLNPACLNHRGEAWLGLFDLRFQTFDKLKEHWNGLLPS